LGRSNDGCLGCVPVLHAVAVARWQCWFAGRDLWLEGCFGVWGVTKLSCCVVRASCRAVSCVLHSDQAGAGGWQGVLS